MSGFLSSLLSYFGNFGAGSVSAAASATPAPTLITAPGSNLEFNLVWDSSVGGAGSNEAPFMTAVEDAAQFFAKNFTAPSPEVVTLHVGYGEVAGTTLPFGALSASSSEGDYVSYATLANALTNVNQNSSDALIKNYTLGLPSSDPTGQATASNPNPKDFFVPYAEEKALGLPIGTSGYQTAVDGWIGLAKNSFFTRMDYTDDPLLNKTGSMPHGGYDAVGAAAHEIGEVLGRIAGLGTSLQPGTGATWTALDLARFTANGVRDLTTNAGYFSLDNGATNLGTFNSSFGGDAGDWANGAYDAFGAYSHTGHYSPVSATDLLETAALGFTLTPTGLANASNPTRVV
jgi:hypothetical protein